MNLLIENSVTGIVDNLTDAASSCLWQTTFRSGAGRLELEYIGEMYPEGSYVSFKTEDSDIFFGRLFESSVDSRGKVRATAYDQLRYLKAEDTVTRKDMTLSAFTTLGCATLQLRTGKIENTELKLPKKIFDGKQWLDMLYESIQENALLNSYWYCLYDDFGAIALRDIEGLKLPLVLGDNSLVHDYSYQSSIESSANQIKVVRPDSNKGVRDTALFRDGDTIARWGLLQHLEKVSENYNTAQRDQRGKLLLIAKNSPQRTFSVQALGDSRVRGGSGIKAEFNDLGIDEWLLVEKATHRFSGGSHTMDLELLVR